MESIDSPTNVAKATNCVGFQIIIVCLAAIFNSSVNRFVPSSWMMAIYNGYPIGALSREFHLLFLSISFFTLISVLVLAKVSVFGFRFGFFFLDIIV